MLSIAEMRVGLHSVQVPNVKRFTTGSHQDGNRETKALVVPMPKNSTTLYSDVSKVKLACQLLRPEHFMLIGVVALTLIDAATVPGVHVFV